MTPRELIDLAAESGLSWVELPARMLGDTSPAALREVREFAEDRGIRFVLAAGNVKADHLREQLPLAAELGAPTIRCTLSSVLCGDRRGFDDGWHKHLDRCARELETVVPDAERLKIAVAMENHQDADSEDLRSLCSRFESRYLGVTLDCGNPLAVMEEPLQFASHIAPYLRHAHLKDYRIHPAPNGYRLVRCALGEGVIDFPGLFRIFDAQEWPITRNIEMAALQARQIPMLESTWWDEFSPRDARQILPALSLVWQSLRSPDEEWRTPWERDASAQDLCDYEWRQFRTSLEYLRSLG